MASHSHIEPAFNMLETFDNLVTIQVDFNQVIDVQYLIVNINYRLIGGGITMRFDYSFDGTSYKTYNFVGLSNTSDVHVFYLYPLAVYKQSSDKFFLQLRPTSNTGHTIDFASIHIIASDGITEQVSTYDPITPVNVGLPPFSGYKIKERIKEISFPHIVTQVEGGHGGSGGETDVPTHTHIVSGNVTKLSEPYEANIVAVSVGSEPEVLGQTTSDPVTGDYSIDVYPYTGHVLVYVAPEYGRPFSPVLPVSAGNIIHPSIPDKHVYVVQNDGVLGSSEPTWLPAETISGDVTLVRKELHRPLMNGFVEPVITAITT